jgi:23S rRNA (cytidine1920-2'-O)/16S rRNA (cytidine1409-2'-O)-methyltransferase
MKPEAKERLDRLLHDRGLFDSRQKARRAIEAGAVCVDGKVLLKPGMNVGIESEIAILMETERYVGRGGLKLEEAIHLFDMDFKDRVVLDAGASTGGFTHCALLHGARLVHAVDVGHGQLDARLRGPISAPCPSSPSFLLPISYWPICPSYPLRRRCPR